MASNLGTYTLSSSVKTIVGTDYIGYAAITCLSGSVDVLATGKTINSWGANTAITISLTTLQLEA